MPVEAKRCRRALEHLRQSAVAWPTPGCCRPPDIRSSLTRALAVVESRGCLLKVSAPEVDQCADELVRRGVERLCRPTDQVFGHRTLFFRDPDGNPLEVFADI